MHWVSLLVLAVFFSPVFTTVKPKDVTTDIKKTDFDFISVPNNSDDAIIAFIKNLIRMGPEKARETLNQLKNEVDKRRMMLGQMRGLKFVMG